MFASLEGAALPVRMLVSARFSAIFRDENMLSQTSSSRRRRHRRVTVAGSTGTPAKSPVASPTSFCLPTVAYLEQVDVVVRASKVMHAYGKDVRYDVQVTPTRDSSQHWTVSLSFRDLKIFQQTLLGLLQLGHLCHGECPYLYSSMTDRFPKECYVYSTSSYVVEKRRRALQEWFTTLLTVLRKRENPCSVLPGAVAQTFISFLTKRLPFDHEFRFENFMTRGLSVRSSTDSSGGTPTGLWQTAGKERTESAPFVSTLDTCALCNSHDTVKRTLTTLSCGHRFHDECVVVKLNETLECPTCGHQLHG